MADDDWRYRKAQQLGLIDTRPLGAANDGRKSAATGNGRRPVPPLPPRAQSDFRASAAPAGFARPGSPVAKAPADGPRRLAFFGGTALALLVAAGAGWLLNDAVGDRRMADFPPPVVEQAQARTEPAAATAAPAIPTPPPAALPASLPATETPAATLPVPVPVPVPPPARAVAAAEPPAKTARIVKASAVRRSAVKQPVAKRTARKVVASNRVKPSFNCRRASSPDSRMICASPELAGLDRALARSYRNALRRSDPSQAYRLDRQQSAFLNARAACQSAPCIARLYYRRLGKLDRG